MPGHHHNCVSAHSFHRAEVKLGLSNAEIAGKGYVYLPVRRRMCLRCAGFELALELEMTRMKCFATTYILALSLELVVAGPSGGAVSDATMGTKS